jgi:hypothetical protein
MDGMPSLPMFAFLPEERLNQLIAGTNPPRQRRSVAASLRLR